MSVAKEGIARALTLRRRVAAGSPSRHCLMLAFGRARNSNIQEYSDRSISHFIPIVARRYWAVIYGIFNLHVMFPLTSSLFFCPFSLDSLVHETRGPSDQYLGIQIKKRIRETPRIELLAAIDMGRVGGALCLDAKPRGILRGPFRDLHTSLSFDSEIMSSWMRGAAPWLSADKH